MQGSSLWFIQLNLIPQLVCWCCKGQEQGLCNLSGAVARWKVGRPDCERTSGLEAGAVSWHLGTLCGRAGYELSLEDKLSSHRRQGRGTFIPFGVAGRASNAREEDGLDTDSYPFLKSVRILQDPQWSFSGFNVLKNNQVGVGKLIKIIVFRTPV